MPPSNIKFDANKELKSGLDSLMTTVGTNGICIPLAAAYTLLVKQVNALVGPVAMFKKDIISNIDALTTDVFKEVTSVLNILDSNIPELNLNLSDKTLLDANIFKKTCLDFNDILPNAMKDLINDGINKINEIAGDVISDVKGLANDAIEEISDFTDEMVDDISSLLSSDGKEDEEDEGWEIPDEINSMINNASEFLKNNAISNALSDATKLALKPLNMYRDFIKSTGIIEMLKRLEKFERCMTNPKNCNRPKQEFYFPGTKKYNSRYYMDLFAINLKAEVQLKKITGQVKGMETKAAKTMKALDNFINKPLVKTKPKTKPKK